MARSTQPNPGRNLAATIKQGFQMMAGRDLPNYTLLFLDPAKNQERGQHKNYVLSHLEIGRSSDCDLQYGDTYPTVSRKHAAISVQDGQFVLQHNPAASNSTLVNGQAVHSHHLQNGDEIQFSTDGPRVRFNTSSVKTSTMGMTARMAMWSAQALRPYKYGIATLAILLMSIALYAIYNNTQQKKQMAIMEKEKQELAARQDSLKQAQLALNDELQDKEDQLDDMENKNNVEARRLKSEISRLKRQVAEVKKGIEAKPVAHTSTPPEKSEPTSLPASGGFTILTDEQASAILPNENIYLIRAVKLEIPFIPKDVIEELKLERIDNEFQIKEGGIYTGTGFLSDNGRFITARHMIQAWRYFDWNAIFSQDPVSLYLYLMNFLETNVGINVDIVFEAIDQKGNKLRFKASQFRFDDTHDEKILYLNKDNPEFDSTTVKRPKGAENTDWAYFDIGRKGSITYQPTDLKIKLKPGVKLYSLGYSKGMYLQEKNTPTPLFSVTTLAREVQNDNMLYISDRSFTGGNSGGPVFVIFNRKPIVVGIVSWGTDNVGGIVSISQMY